LSESWEKDVISRAATLGFSSLSEYLASRPAVPYPNLAAEMGAPVMGLQVAELQIRTARAEGVASLRAAAKDALVRCLRQVLTSGWGRTDSTEPGVSRDFVNVSAWTLWGSMIASARPADAIIRDVWQELSIRAPEGWLPTSTDDPVVTAAFDAAWPIR
jgi:hypothetical protein